MRRHASGAAGAAVPCAGAREGEHLPAEGREREKRASTGPLVAGTPGQAAVDEYRGEGRAQRVRAEVSGRTAIQLGEACPGSARGVLRPGGKPLPLPGVDHLGASWGHGRAPLPARGIRTETPPAGAVTAPLYGRGQDNHTRCRRRQAYRLSRPGRDGDATGRGGKRQEKTAAQRLSATYTYAAPSGIRDRKASKDGQQPCVTPKGRGHLSQSLMAATVHLLPSFTATIHIKRLTLLHLGHPAIVGDFACLVGLPHGSGRHTAHLLDRYASVAA